MKKITIIDYGCGNILNLARAIKFLGYEIEMTHDEKKIHTPFSTKLIFDSKLIIYK